MAYILAQLQGVMVTPKTNELSYILIIEYNSFHFKFILQVIFNYPLSFPQEKFHSIFSSSKITKHEDFHHYIVPFDINSKYLEKYLPVQGKFWSLFQSFQFVFCILHQVSFIFCKFIQIHQSRWMKWIYWWIWKKEFITLNLLQ